MELIMKVVIVMAFVALIFGFYIGEAIHAKRKYNSIYFWSWLLVFGLPTSCVLAMVVMKVIALVLCIFAVPILLIFK